MKSSTEDDVGGEPEARINPIVRESPVQKNGPKEFMEMITMIKQEQPCDCLERFRL